MGKTFKQGGERRGMKPIRRTGRRVDNRRDEYELRGICFDRETWHVKHDRSE